MADKLFSLRNFLKLGGVLVAGGIGAYQLNHAFGEYDLVDRKKVLDKLINQKDTPQGKETLAAWLKFNACEMYAKKQGWPLSEKTIQHFLYGNGQELNPTQQMSESLIKFGNGYLPLEHKLTENEAWKVFAKDSLDEIFTPNDPYAQQLSLSPSKDIIKKNLERDQPQIFQFQGVSVAGNIDFGNSLAYHTVVGSVLIENSQQVDGGWNVSGKNFRFKFLDRYDWDEVHGNIGANSGDLILDVMSDLGFSNSREFITKNFDKETTNYLLQTPIVYDREGALLEQKGYAKSYDLVTDEINIFENINFYIPHKSLKGVA